MNLRFFPSRRLSIYLARLFLTRSFAVLAGLVLILMTLDLLQESADILEQPGNGDAQVWRYVGLRIPQLIQRFLPFSVLLGCIIALVNLNQHSEVVAMKAAGISAHQIIAPLMLASLFVAAGSFVFNERIVTRATASLKAWQAVEYGPAPPEAGVRENVWIEHHDDLIQVDRVIGRGPGMLLQGITIHGRSGGTLETITSAARGRYTGNGWLLENASSFHVGAGRRTTARTMTLPGDIEPVQFTLANVDPAEQDFGELQQSIDDLRRADRATSALEASLWHKISGPLSTILMPLLAAVAAFGLARSGQLLLRAVIGMFLGFTYFVADNFAIAMGNFGAYPPLLAAWGPFALFLLIGEAVLVRTEE